MLALVIGYIIGGILGLIYRITLAVSSFFIEKTVFLIRKISRVLEDALVYLIRKITQEVKTAYLKNKEDNRLNRNINTKGNGVK
ncbi:hypothetical protein [Staphylococcus sp. RIT622]|uniref:hypothetical protein n=1 Tax=Staphylococcus sp. RIT622 TaxID=2510795 RepID=UPI00101E2D41|nr:hypothetical protein [Staphylococcus sp. RIT622]MCG2544206.1 hypothetical protein [Staphylococcus epidermidis]RYL09568.1 hypothetical protein EU553_11610 [Staphylococcus sp. RIT622]